MILVGGENLIDFVQTDTPDGAALYQAIPGGSCYNCAIATARQGQDVTYMTPVSEDALGAMLEARLAQDNIALAAQRVSQPTSLAVRFRTSSAHVWNRWSMHVVLLQAL